MKSYNFIFIFDVILIQFKLKTNGSQADSNLPDSLNDQIYFCLGSEGCLSVEGWIKNCLLLDCRWVK